MLFSEGILDVRFNIVDFVFCFYFFGGVVLCFVIFFMYCVGLHKILLSVCCIRCRSRLRGDFNG